MFAARNVRMVVGASGGVLDTQTVTSGGNGTALNGDRRRGFILASIGSISDGTSNIYGGAAITEFYYDELQAWYLLTITGATNGGWTQVSINGTTILTRTAAAFSAGTWTWGTTEPIVSQAFGASTTVHTCIFS